MKRRQILQTALLAAGAGMLPLRALAQAGDYPNRPIRFIVPFAPGGVTDFMTRLMAKEFGEALGQPVIVENKGGSGGMIGSDFVAKSAPDGYTILLGTSATHAMNPHISNVNFDPIKDFAPVGLYGANNAVLVVNPDFPVKTFQELLAYVKERPGQLSYASQGVGTSGHLAGELLKQHAGLDLVHVPYKGSGPALTDVLGGQVPMMFDNVTPSLPHIRAGKLRPLAVTSLDRSPLLPDVPTMAESGLSGFEVVGWIAIFAPAGTPPAVIEKLNAAMKTAIDRPEILEKLREAGIKPTLSTPEDLGDYLVAQHEKWGKVIRQAGIRNG
ncbi:Bug family tripartite tricarboxylate transporter substrate binding protein [Paracandidimonas soli]|uniref:Tripartite-type tricarboxylate transporter receptor subunit TctC n=1 Tax=Paracandidimonas soli TaxID=1917182 RepID=A0A4R3USL7_9BURK|nr:tripartite tricarboxylate transporter substrate binding protein [Paracandidimonas soli]TCU93881.1 tripartite-type tricarboxylate transporter receptor subunit TctC [Paracandidimonas soli]